MAPQAADLPRTSSVLTPGLCSACAAGQGGGGGGGPHHQLSRVGCEETRWSTLDRVLLC